MIEPKVRIITDTTTFYPIESDNDSHRNDDLSLRATLVYMHEQIGEDFQYFKADDLFIVLQQWRDLLFFIQSNDERYKEIMLLQLQTIREIIIFLFGTKFENVMKRSISLSKRQVFALYVDTYLKLCKKDFLFMMNSTRFNLEDLELNKKFEKNLMTISNGMDINLTAVILFENHKIIGKYLKPGSLKLEQENLLMLTIFEQVEYENIDDSSKVIDIDFVKSPQNLTIKHKNAYLRVDRSPVPFTLSSSRMGLNSPYVILVVTQNVKMQQEMKDTIQKYIYSIAESLNTIDFKFSKYLQGDLLDDLLYFIIIDRTNGIVWEMDNIKSILLLENYLSNNDQNFASNFLEEIKTKLISYGMNAMIRGFTTMMWGENDFQYFYQLIFEDDDEIIKPSNVFKPPPFHDDIGITYRLMINNIFQTNDDISCVELFTVYKGKILVKDAIIENQLLYESLGNVKMQVK